MRLEVGAANERAHEEQYQPTVSELRAYSFAVTAYRDRARYGFPRAGGYLDQPARWKIALDCVEDAKYQADQDAALLVAQVEDS